MQTGIRDLRDHLSAYLDQVRAGSELVVTDRGNPVARLVPLTSGERMLDRLAAEGLVERAPDPQRRRPQESIDAEGPVSDLVIDQRR